ncbi:MBL fold metallo-hydrolase [Aliifodinibius sp. S!AR15-10]|uniref:MBL fold metallo-hydrolase n=1 Tax=Aliifodinibius sp. S!AR15-10 TaxID=2950437 RepID=UPI00285CA8E7|nr:MBL fold metallo-hydrolase [Aliifodinibius sp. S!AR15-10]MDR8393748.1 MBL fold metallo-hydrolase [Aliifodinibius sp. S!AR15-10]
MYFKQIFDKKLAQYSYIIGCQANGEAIVIDPLRDIDQYHQLAENEGLEITAAADTHIHADYVSGLREFAEQGIKVYGSDEGGRDWKYEWLIDSDYNYELITGGDSFSIGNIRFDAVHTPGHTPESVSFLVTDGAATDQPMGILSGDFVFVGDIGRPDLLETAAGQKGAMKPAARELYQSVQNFKDLPKYLQVWPAHGSGSACGKALGAVPETTVGYELRFSPAFKASTSENKFVDFILDGQPEPPLYFGRMKKVNREGPAVLRTLPKPDHITIDEIKKSSGIILDTRTGEEFAAGHLSGSLLATFDSNFNTIAGSYAEADEDLYLVIEEQNLEQAIRDLVRVGLDNVKGYISPEELKNWTGGKATIKSIDFEIVADQAKDPNVQVLDVRKATEYAEGHISGSRNIAHTRLPEHLGDLSKEQEILVHCGTGQRASYAAALLARNGFTVQWVADEFANWSKYQDKVSDYAVTQ